VLDFDVEVCGVLNQNLKDEKSFFVDFIVEELNQRWSEREILDRNGNEIFELFGPLLHPWTFQIKKGGLELGKITKKWSGLVKESFTDADNFGITFPEGIDLSQKAVLLGAVFLIDFIHFENSGNRN